MVQYVDMTAAGNRTRGGLYGLAAAALFGISLPFIKLLLPESGPLLIAGLLYLGAGIGLWCFELAVYRHSKVARREAPIQSTDRWLLAGIVVAGGILGPVLMLWGLQRLSAVASSLLLNLEAPLTIALALLFFREHLDRREVLGAIVIIGAAAVLNYHPGTVRTDWLGFVAIVSACLCWAIDNNLSQRLSLRDPIVVTRIKTLGAGACTLSLAILTGQSLPRPSILMAALVLGLFSYGLSLVLDMQALRLVGAAREAGYFATAPFIGAVAAVPIVGEQWGATEWVSSAAMAVGVTFLLRAHHRHLHVHEEVEHDHTHMHGEHHQHEHEEQPLTEESHTHAHRHLPLAHDHPHLSELHHRHEHG